MYGTQPGWYHDFCCCYWRFYNGRGEEVAVISDEAYARGNFTPRDIVLASS